MECTDKFTAQAGCTPHGNPTVALANSDLTAAWETEDSPAGLREQQLYAGLVEALHPYLDVLGFDKPVAEITDGETGWMLSIHEEGKYPEEGLLVKLRAMRAGTSDVAQADLVREHGHREYESPIDIVRGVPGTELGLEVGCVRAVGGSYMQPPDYEFMRLYTVPHHEDTRVVAQAMAIGNARADAYELLGYLDMAYLGKVGINPPSTDDVQRDVSSVLKLACPTVAFSVKQVDTNTVQCEFGGRRGIVQLDPEATATAQIDSLRSQLSDIADEALELQAERSGAVDGYKHLQDVDRRRLSPASILDSR